MPPKIKLQKMLALILLTLISGACEIKVEEEVPAQPTVVTIDIEFDQADLGYGGVYFQWQLFQNGRVEYQGQLNGDRDCNFAIASEAHNSLVDAANAVYWNNYRTNVVDSSFKGMVYLMDVYLTYADGTRDHRVVSWPVGSSHLLPHDMKTFSNTVTATINSGIDRCLKQ